MREKRVITPDAKSIFKSIFFTPQNIYMFFFFFKLKTCINVGKKSLLNMIRDITYYEITTPPTYLKNIKFSRDRWNANSPSIK